jgi:hypothetical protein
MDGLKLLELARAAGLAVRVDGEKLVVRGPRKAEAVAKRLLENKAVVIAALCASEPQHDHVDLAQNQAGVRLCPCCRRSQRWLSVYGVTVCGECHPPAVPELVKRWLEPKEN